MNPSLNQNDSANKAAGTARYAQLFQGSEAVARYQRKLSNRIDILRDKIERDILASRLKGNVFDCTIGVGRFIGKLPNVTAYDGMDLSSEFVEYVRQLHPSGKLFTADLSQPIPLSTGSYDNVLCLRSLSGIGRLATILPEMLRITRSGGLLIFDYGRKRTISHVKGEMTVLDGDDLEGVIKTLDAKEIERIRVDAALTRAKIHARLFRFLTGSRGHVVSDKLLLQAERVTAPMFWQRQIIILRRN
ncbi:methyltransferase domain-containing protein [Oxalobacteraceae bacterium CAVE-383]|nr:methyltransferase domain-containing protein [Oxalobacteraceae bacterium CAVE-383]